MKDRILLLTICIKQGIVLIIEIYLNEIHNKEETIC